MQSLNPPPQPNPQVLVKRDRARVRVAYGAAVLSLLCFLTYLVIAATTSRESHSPLTHARVLLGFWAIALMQYLVLFYVGMRRMRQFLATHSDIDNPVAVVALKAVVRHNMVLAYPLLVLGLVAVASALMLLQGRGLMGYLCMGIFLLANGLSTRRMKALEQLVRSLPATSGECAQAQAEANQRWKKSQWPNF